MLIQELDKAVIPGELERGFEYCKKLNTQRNINFDHVFKDLLDKIQNTFTL